MGFKAVFLGLIVSSIAICLSACQTIRFFKEGTLLIRNVYILDLQTGSTSELSWVLLDEDRIVRIEKEGSRALPTSIPQIDGQGQFLMPGLWDMHVHMCWLPGWDTIFAEAFLKYGITGVRDMGGDTEVLRAYRQRILEKPTLGPIIHGAGPILDGDPPVFADFSLPLNGDSPIEAVLDSLRSMGVDFFKVYSLLDSASLHRIATHTDQHGLTFAGHLSEYVPPSQSIAWGQASVEHLNRLDELWPDDQAQLARLVDLMRSKGTFLCPTSIIYQKKATMNDSLATWRAEDNAAIPPLLQMEWQRGLTDRMERYPDPADWTNLRKGFSEQLDLVNYFHQAGIPILAGSDFAGMPFVYPGFGLHEELALLAEAGLSPLEALQSATIQPARFLGLSDHYGMVKEGYQADLLLLHANPLENISSSQSIVEVIRGGKLVKK